MAAHVFDEDERPPLASCALFRWTSETGSNTDSSDPRHAANRSHGSLRANLFLPVVLTCSGHRSLQQFLACLSRYLCRHLEQCGSFSSQRISSGSRQWEQVLDHGWPHSGHLPRESSGGDKTLPPSPRFRRKRQAGFLQIKYCTIYALRDERNICKLFMVVNPVCYVGLTTDIASASLLS